MMDTLETIPAHFCAGVAQRAAVWEALPPSAQESLRGTSLELERLTEELGATKAQLQSLVDDIWAARFDDAAVCKARLVGNVLPLVTQRYRELWDSRRLAAGTQQAATIYDLDTHLLGDILARVIASPSAATLEARSAEARCKRFNPDPASAPPPESVVAQVCRLWEVMAYASRRSLTHALARPGTPPSLAVRVIDRIVLSSQLEVVEVYVSKCHAACALELATLAALLPRCVALHTVNITLEGDHRNAVAVPHEIVGALPRCVSLTRLSVEGRNNKATLTSESVAALERVMALVQLEGLQLINIDTRASDTLLPALARHSSLQRLDLSSCSATPGWGSLLLSPHLTQLAACYDRTFLPVPHAAAPIESQIAQLSLRYVDLHEHGVQFAALLAQLTALSSLDFDFLDAQIADTVLGLPALQALSLDCNTHTTHTPQWQRKHAVVCNLLAQCTRIQSLSLVLPFAGHFQSEWRTRLAATLAAGSHLKKLSLEDPDNKGLLGHLLDVVPAMHNLEELCLAGKVDLGQLCRLGVRVSRSACLKCLRVYKCDLGADERIALRACTPNVKLFIA